MSLVLLETKVLVDLVDSRARMVPEVFLVCTVKEVRQVLLEQLDRWVPKEIVARMDPMERLVDLVVPEYPAKWDLSVRQDCLVLMDSMVSLELKANKVNEVLLGKMANQVLLDLQAKTDPPVDKVLVDRQETVVLLVCQENPAKMAKMVYVVHEVLKVIKVYLEVVDLKVNEVLPVVKEIGENLVLQVHLVCLVHQGLQEPEVLVEHEEAPVVVGSKVPLVTQDELEKMVPKVLLVPQVLMVPMVKMVRKVFLV